MDRGPTHTAPVLAMEQHGGEYRNSTHTAPVLLREQHGRLYGEVNQTRPVHGAYKSKEQSDYIQQLSADQGSCNTVKQGVMKSISEKLQGMKLHEIRKFQENLPENLSQVRQSRRLMGIPPEAFKTTGSKVEDGRIVLNSDRVHYRR